MTEPENLNDSQFGPMKPYYPHRGSPEKRAQPTQGKLFQEGKPQTPARWPRGYSPERMAAVKEHGPVITGGDQPYSHTLTGSTLDSPYNAPHGRRLVQEAIARSSMDVTKLKDLSGIHLHSGMQYVTGTPSVMGDYEPANRQINMYPLKGDLSVKGPKGGVVTSITGGRGKPTSLKRALPRFDAGLMHEIGHHVDFTTRFPVGSSREMTPERTTRYLKSRTGVGKTEGAADRFMLQHFQNDPRNQRRTGFNIQRQTYGFRGTTPKTMPGYDPQLSESGAEERKRADVEDYQAARRNQGRKEHAQLRRKAVTRYKQQLARRKKRT